MKVDPFELKNRTTSNQPETFSKAIAFKKNEKVPATAEKKPNRNILGRVPFQRDPLFTIADYAIVNRAISCLSAVEQGVLALHFWEGLSIPQICSLLNLSWQAVDSLLSQAFQAIYKSCVLDPAFSRTEVSMRSQHLTWVAPGSCLAY